MELAVQRRDSRRHSSRRVVARLARTLMLALVGGCLLALALTMRQVSQGDVSALLACGLGKPQTMLANKIPALFYPSLQNNPQNVQGVFPLDYAVNTQIGFTEDLSRAPGSPSNSIFTWRWSFGDGTGYVYQASPTHTFTKPGAYNVTSWVYIDGSWADDDPFDSSQIHIAASIPPDPPVAKLTSSLAVTALSQSVSFSAAGSHSTDGSQLTYKWNFNDSGEASGSSATHKFVTIAGGSTFVALVVTDARGAQSLATVNITIQPQQNPPSASLSASDLEVDTGDTITFDASQSAVPTGVLGDTLTKYVWNFGDGTAPQTTQTPTTSHRFPKTGSYAVTMTVYDKNQTQATAMVHVKVLGAASSGGVSPLVVIGAIALLIGLGIGAYAFWQQRRRAEMVRQYQEAQALARARRTQRGPRAPGGNGGNGGNNGYSNPGSGSGYGRQPAMRGGPPPRTDRAPSSGQLGQRRPPTSNGSSGGRAPRQGSQSSRGDW